MKILWLGKVRVRAIAKSIGEPSPSKSCGYASTSSKIKFRIGTDRNPAALLAPTISSRPPGKFFCVIVLLLSLLLAGATRCFSSGQFSISGSMRPLDNRSTILSVGCTNMVGAGAMCME